GQRRHPREGRRPHQPADHSSAVMNFLARTAVIALVAVAAVPLACAASGPEITLQGDRLRVSGAVDGTLTVAVAGSDVSLFGEATTDGSGLVFVPRFPFKP